MNPVDLFRIGNKGYRLQYRDPRKRRLSAAFMLLLLVLLGVSLYRLGGTHAEERLGADTRELASLRSEVARLDEVNRDLMQRSTLAERTAEVERQSSEQVRETLRQMEVQIQALDEELLLYRAIVSQEHAENGLFVQSLRVEPADGENAFSWRLMLAQARGAAAPVEGDVELAVQARRGGVITTLDHAEILPEGQGDVKFGFRYFQSLEGGIRLPEGFQPVAALVRLKPKDSNLPPVEKRFIWSSVIAGG